MVKCTASHTKKQFRKRWKKIKWDAQAYNSLVTILMTVPDPRSDQGKRYDLVVFLFILIVGTAFGRENVASCVELAVAHSKQKVVCPLCFHHHPRS